MKKVKKPFRSGKCSACRSQECLETQTLCSACEPYVNQDYVGRDELPIDEKAIDRRAAKIEYAFQEEVTKSEIKRLPKVNELLKEASLSKQQIKIMKLNFVKGYTWTEISLKLKISKSSVQSQMERSLKKLRFCHAKDRSMKGIVGYGKGFPTNKKSIDPYLYYSKCPKCDGTDLQGKANKGCCLSCGWIFSVYSVEEVQATHPHPKNPILDGLTYELEN